MDEMMASEVKVGQIVGFAGDRDPEFVTIARIDTIRPGLLRFTGTALNTFVAEADDEMITETDYYQF